MKSNLRVLCCLSLALCLAPLTARAGKSAAPQPGSYKEWHDVDQVTIVQPFQLGNYQRVVVQPLETSNATLPDAKDNSYPAVKAALATSAQPFSDGMRSKLGGSNLALQVGREGGAGALIVRAKITKSDPGSQAARYFAGFGAGAAKVEVSGEIVDGRSGKTLVRFVQERRSGVGAFGGGYRELLERSLRQIGGDVAGRRALRAETEKSTNARANFLRSDIKTRVDQKAEGSEEELVWE